MSSASSAPRRFWCRREACRTVSVFAEVVEAAAAPLAEAFVPELRLRLIVDFSGADEKLLGFLVQEAGLICSSPSGVMDLACVGWQWLQLRERGWKAGIRRGTVAATADGDGSRDVGVPETSSGRRTTKKTAFGPLQRSRKAQMRDDAR